MAYCEDIHVVQPRVTGIATNHVHLLGASLRTHLVRSVLVTVSESTLIMFSDNWFSAEV